MEDTLENIQSIPQSGQLVAPAVNEPSAISYSIAETAKMLNLSTKTIRRYIKAGKLPSVKAPTKYGEEYRITEIPEALKEETRKEVESAEEDPPDAVAELVTEAPPAQESTVTLDARQLYQENIRLAVQLGAATERIHNLEQQLKLLEAPKLTWWQRLFHLK